MLEVLGLEVVEVLEVLGLEVLEVVGRLVRGQCSSAPGLVD